MKPLYLEMTAFGSYGDTVKIDFSDFAGNLYLITGDTGAGKTTIFDAIMIALFGESSGKSRSFEEMHSDFVGRDVPTEVLLTFCQNGIEYKVKRTLRFRNKGLGSKDENAYLWEPDREVLEKKERVTARIEEILGGINADKFRKIVMLAQGEFKKFLEDKSDAKSKILGELFDSSPYEYYQNLLKAAKDRLEGTRREYQQEIESVMKNFEEPAGMDEKSESFLPGHSALLANLEALTVEDEMQAGILKQKKEEAQEEYQKLSTAQTLAMTNNQNLHALAALELHQKGLEEKKPSMTMKMQQAKTVANAFRQIIPKETDLLKVEKEVSDLRQAISSQKEMKELQEKCVQETQLREQADEPKKLREEELNGQIKVIEETFADYERLEKARAYKAKNEPEMERAGKSITDAQSTIERQKQYIAALEKDSENYTDVDAEAERAKQQKQRCSEDLLILTHPKTGVLIQCRQILEEEALLKKLLLEEQKLLEKTRTATDVYMEQNRLFLAGQAGILAEKLGEEIQEKGAAVCPVCGTNLTMSDQKHFCEKQLDTPTEDEVKQARDTAEQWNAAFNGKRQEVAKQEQHLDGLKKNAVASVARLREECNSYEQLMAGDYLPCLQKELEERGKAAEELIAKADGRQKAARKLVEDLKKARVDLESYGTALERWKKYESEVQAGLIKANEVIGMLQSKLLYKNAQEAKEQRDILLKESQTLKDEREKHARELVAEKQKLSKIDGALAMNLQSLPQKEEQAVAARKRLEEALREYQFSSVEEVHQILFPVKEESRSVEQWIENRLEEWNQYLVDCNTTKEKVRDLKEKTEGVKEVDLDELKNQVLAAKEMQDKAGEAYTDFQYVKKNHEFTRDKVAAAKAHLAGTDQAYRRIEKLSDLAAATKNTEGGRLSFERFVMGSVFKEILMMANQRLDIMTGGKYELIHEMGTGHKNVQAGFDIHVLDHTTGKERPSDTLSGGESFLVSLSLALGLSDVVQERAGGIQLDSMFVDEGFGSLDENTLDKAVKVLERLTEGNRLVGIISHVAKLEECIGQQVQVRSGERGSSISIRN